MNKVCSLVITSIGGGGGGQAAGSERALPNPISILSPSPSPEPKLSPDSDSNSTLTPPLSLHLLHPKVRDWSALAKTRASMKQRVEEAMVGRYAVVVSTE